ncbi:MAG: hypothetical protein ABSC15_02985 [Terriglobales bacterium]|jgi:hypothetical protein
MIQVEIKADINLVRKQLGAFPGAAKWALQQSILKALRQGRTKAAQAAAGSKGRYTIPYTWVLRQIGTPRISGLTGFMKASGSKAPLSMFPFKDIYPYGVAAQELKPEYGLPVNIRHAFGWNAFVRAGRGAPRFPIHRMVGLSAPQMIGEQSEVLPKIEKSLAEDQQAELGRLMYQIVSGNLKRFSPQ